MFRSESGSWFVRSFLPLTCIAVALLGMFALVNPSSEAGEARALAPHVPGELLIKFRGEAPTEGRNAAREFVAATKRRTFDSGAEHWQLGTGVSVEAAIAALAENPLIEYAEPNAIGEFDLVPLDPNYSEQWAPPLIQAEEAWDRTTGSSSVVVAVLDSGIDFDVDDLGVNKWTNAAEVAGQTGVDDDLNGYVDDKDGWDFKDGDNNPFPSENPHGTNIAGIIGAHGSTTQGGSLGIAGLNWTIRLMNLKVGTTSLGTEAQVSAAVDYARKNGAQIINASWKFNHCTQPCNSTLKAAMQLAGDHEVLVVASAGNDNRNIDDPNQTRNPASFDLLNVITVAASDANDNQADFPGDEASAWGLVSVDLAAPGLNIRTTDTDKAPGGTDEDDRLLAWFSGTSSAAPHVVGVAALLRSISLNIPFELLRARLLDPSNLDDIPDFDQAGSHPIVTGGRLNALGPIDDEETTAPTAIATITVPSKTYNSVTLRWNATGDDGSTGNAAMHKVRYSSAAITEANWVKAKLGGVISTSVAPGTQLDLTVDNLLCGTAYYFKVKGYDEWGNGPISTNTGTISTQTPICTTSYCQEQSIRCTWNGTCAGAGCCNYSCVEDESCTGPDECPGNACACN